MEEPELLEKLQNTKKFDKKTLPKFLKYLEKIKSVGEYPKYIKKNITIPFVEWILQVLLIRPFVIFCLLVLLAFKVTSALILAESISLSWFLLIEFIKEVRGTNGERS